MADNPNALKARFELTNAMADLEIVEDTIEHFRRRGDWTATERATLFESRFRLAKRVAELANAYAEALG